MTPAEFEAKIAALAAAHPDTLGYSEFHDAVGIAGPLRRATLAGAGHVVDVYLFQDGGAGLRLDWRWIGYELIDYANPGILLDDAFDRLAAAVELIVERA